MKSLKSMKRKRKLGDSRPAMGGTPIYLPTETKNRLKMYCTAKNLSMGRVVAALVEDYMECGKRFDKSVDEYLTSIRGQRTESTSIVEVTP